MAWVPYVNAAGGSRNYHLVVHSLRQTKGEIEALLAFCHKFMRQPCLIDVGYDRDKRAQAAPGKRQTL